MNPSLLERHCSICREMWSSGCLVWTRLCVMAAHTRHLTLWFWSACASVYFSFSIWPTSQSCCACFCLQMHRNCDYYTTWVHHPKRQTGIDRHLVMFFVLEFMPNGNANKTYRERWMYWTHFICLCWTYLLEPIVSRSNFKPLSCFQLCQQLVIWCQWSACLLSVDPQ